MNDRKPLVDLEWVEEELEKIRRRHALMESPPYAYATRTMGHWTGKEGQRAHADRAFLLDCVTRLSDAVVWGERALDSEQDECATWRLRAETAQEDNARMRAALPEVMQLLKMHRCQGKNCEIPGELSRLEVLLAPPGGER